MPVTMRSREGWLTVLLACCVAVVAAPADVAVAAEVDGEEGSRAEVVFTYGLRAFQHEEYREARSRFEEAARLDPDDGTARYWLGLTRLRLKDAAGAVADIQAGLNAKRPARADRAAVLASLGEAQLEAGDPAGAEKSLAGALALHPDDAATLYLRGVALARAGKAEEGRAAAERARQIDPTLPELPAQSVPPGSGGELVGPAAQPFLEIRVAATTGYDSNPSVLSDDFPVVDPATGLETDRSDTAGNTDLRLEIHPFYGRGGWSLGLRLDAYQSFHQDFDTLDLGQARGLFQLAWGKDPLGYVTGPLGYTRVPSGGGRLSFLLQGGTAYTELDGDSYVRNHEAAASMTIREGRTTATQIDLEYQDLNYFQGTPILAEEDLTGHQTSLRASQYLFGGRRDRYVRFGVLAGEGRRGLEFFNTSILEGSVELSVPVSRRLVLFFDSAWRRDDMDEGVAPHEEATYSATAALVWAFADRLYLTGRLGTVRHNVEGVALDLLEYDRTIATVGVTWHH